MFAGVAKEPEGKRRGVVVKAFALLEYLPGDGAVVGELFRNGRVVQWRDIGKGDEDGFVVFEDAGVGQGKGKLFQGLFEEGFFVGDVL